jgi:hypothetical protein
VLHGLSRCFIPSRVFTFHSFPLGLAFRCFASCTHTTSTPLATDRYTPNSPEGQNEELLCMWLEWLGSYSAF